MNKHESKGAGEMNKQVEYRSTKCPKCGCSIMYRKLGKLSLHVSKCYAIIDHYKTLHPETLPQRRAA
jgi:hypothetical protein